MSDLVAVALGAGGVRGAAHVGVLEYFQKRGFRPSMLVGSSAGAVVSTLYAAGLPFETLAELFGVWPEPARDPRSRLLPWTFWGSVLEWLAVHVIHLGPGRVRESLWPAARFDPVLQRVKAAGEWSSLPTRVAAVATDLRSGLGVVFGNGPNEVPPGFVRGDAPLLTAVRASSAIPGWLPAVRVGGWELVDGGVVSPVPAAVAQAWGARAVVAVDVGVGRTPVAPVRGASDIVDRAEEVILSRLSWWELSAAADVTIRPRIDPHTTFSPKDIGKLIAAGRAAAETAWPEVERLLERRPQ